MSEFMMDILLSCTTTNSRSTTATINCPPLANNNSYSYLYCHLGSQNELEATDAGEHF